MSGEWCARGAAIDLTLICKPWFSMTHDVTALIALEVSLSRGNSLSLLLHFSMLGLRANRTGAQIDMHYLCTGREGRYSDCARVLGSKCGSAKSFVASKIRKLLFQRTWIYLLDLDPGTKLTIRIEDFFHKASQCKKQNSS